MQCLTTACLTSAWIALCTLMAFISPHGGSIVLVWTCFTRFNNYGFVETQISPLVYKEQHSQRCHKNLHNTLQSPQSSLCIQSKTTSLFIVLIRMKLLLQSIGNTINNQRTLRDFFLKHLGFTKMYLISLEASYRVVVRAYIATYYHHVTTFITHNIKIP
jgi:hypothetical protein